LQPTNAGFTSAFVGVNRDVIPIIQVMRLGRKSDMVKGMTKQPNDQNHRRRAAPSAACCYASLGRWPGACSASSPSFRHALL
jgi:hypothetical protein